MPLDPLKLAKDALEKAVETEKRNRSLLASLGPAVIDALKPLFQELKKAIAALKLDVEPVIHVSPEIKLPEIRVPDVIVPDIEVPEPKVTVNVPPLKVPDVIMPEEMKVRGGVSLTGVDLDNPLPVQLRDRNGKPVSLIENMTQIISAAGGKRDFLTVKGFSQSAYADYLNADNRLRVSVETGSGLVSDVNLKQVLGNPTVVGSGYQDNALRVVHATDAVASVNVVSSAAVDTELPAAAALGDADANPTAPMVGAALMGFDGAAWERLRTGVRYSDGALAVVHATDSGVSVSATQVTSPWVTSISGALSSAVAVGPVVADAVDDGNAPVQVGGIARQANPTAVAAGKVVKLSLDDVGRPLMRPVQVRDLTVTAYATLTTGTEATLLAASAGSFHDLIYIMGANNSDAAVTVDIRPVTAGNVVMTIQIPANGTAGVATPVPYPQSASDTGNNWTADMGDITGTTVYLSALFTREV